MPPVLLLTAGIADAAIDLPDAALLLADDGAERSIIAAGPIAELTRRPDAAGATTVELPDHVLIPGLVNAHAHLDLTGIGPMPFDREAGFQRWLANVRTSREQQAPDLAGSIAAGIRRSLLGGVVAIGDIAGSDLVQTLSHLRASPLIATVFAEHFGLGERQSPALGHMSAIADSYEPSDRIRLGLSPHAPYTCGPAVYASAAAFHLAHGIPLTTHLAESRAERELIAEATGPLRALLEGYGLWTTAAAADFGAGRSPVEHIRDELTGAPWILAHANDCSDADLAILAQTSCSVAYCPRASAYFHHHDDLGPHRYADMIGAGVNVAIGTDSIISLPPDQADRLSPLDDIRLLHRRDGADPRGLLAMATTNGARALGLDEARFTLAHGPLAGLVAIDVSATDRRLAPGARALAAMKPPELLFPTLAVGDPSRLAELVEASAAAPE